jgi:hypothetical protein
MLVGVCLICVTCLGWAIAAAATARPADAARRRDRDRRFRQLSRHPEWVNFLDVENFLLADSIPLATVDRVMRRADGRRLGARTMWRWARAHGADRLVIVVDAGLAEDTLLDHLDAGTTPDWHSLTVVADLANDAFPAGIPLDELVDLDVVPELADLTFPDDLAEWETTTLAPEELSRFDALPPIAEPGLRPFLPIATSDRGGDDWPAVA